MSSSTLRPPQVGDFCFIDYLGSKFTTKITSINGLTLYLVDEVNKTNTTLTWNGTEWLLPGNLKPNSVQFYFPPSNSITLPTNVVDVHVGCIRPEYNNLKEWTQNPNNIYIGRKGVVFVDGVRFPPQDSKFANPYKVSKDGTLAEVISKYRIYLQNKIRTGEVTRDDLLALKGKNLGCWCKSTHNECHGDVIVEEINKL